MPWFLTKNKFLCADVTRRLSWKECCVTRGFTNCCCLLCIKIRLLKGHLHDDDILLSRPESFRVSLVQISATLIQTSLGLLNIRFCSFFRVPVCSSNQSILKSDNKKKQRHYLSPKLKTNSNFRLTQTPDQFSKINADFQTSTPTPAQKQTISFENKFQSWKLTSSDFLKHRYSFKTSEGPPTRLSLYLSPYKIKEIRGI